MSHPVPADDREPAPPIISATPEETHHHDTQPGALDTAGDLVGAREPGPSLATPVGTSLDEKPERAAFYENAVGTSFYDHPDRALSYETDREAAPAAAARPAQDVAADLGMDHDAVLAREKERFGGMKIGSAFLGWMAAAGVAVLLIALLAATGVALGISNHTTAADITNQAAAATGTARTIGLIGAIALLVIIFIAYYAGGYTAGRMARFNGTKQGLAVWLWSLFFAVVIAILVAVFGSKFNVLSTLNLPSLPVGQGNTTLAGIIGVAAVVLVSIGAALLGGAAGMLYHRKVDRTGLTL